MTSKQGSEVESAHVYISRKGPQMLRDQAEFLRARSGMQSEDGTVKTSPETAAVCIEQAEWLERMAEFFELATPKVSSAVTTQ